MSESGASESELLVARLRSPTHSDLCKKRKVDAHPPPLGREWVSGQALHAKYVPKFITPAQRAREFPDEHLVVSVGKPFCRACKETLCTKRSVVLNHVNSSKQRRTNNEEKQT